MRKKQQFRIKIMCIFYIFLSGLTSSDREDIREILHAPDKKTFQNIIEKQNRTAFLKQLCQTQKRFSRIPWGCYELQPFNRKNDPFCLKLSVKNLTIESLKEALSLKTLSSRCRKHLSLKLKILNYRKSKKELDTI